MRRLWRAFVVLMALTALVAPTGASAHEPDRCFETPGIVDCLHYQFSVYWAQNGDLPVFGFPISDAATEFDYNTHGHYLSQWLERNRFEHHPENAHPYDVLLGRLGDERLRQMSIYWEHLPRESGPKAGCLWFPQTRHNVCNQANGVGFKTYWQTHGLQDLALSPYERSLALFGLPLTEPKMETNAEGDTVLTQWFERARFEWHPRNPDGSKVLLGLLGKEILEAGQLTNIPAPTGVCAQNAPRVAEGLQAWLTEQPRRGSTKNTLCLRLNWRGHAVVDGIFSGKLLYRQQPWIGPTRIGDSGVLAYPIDVANAPATGTATMEVYVNYLRRSHMVKLDVTPRP